jgi:hypothetical protein
MKDNVMQFHYFGESSLSDDRVLEILGQSDIIEKIIRENGYNPAKLLEDKL